MQSQNTKKEDDRKAAIAKEININARLDFPHIAMNVLAAIIASYGLLADSPAVVIGAMIVAMLLAPILGVALGLAESNHRIIMEAGISLAGGVGAVYAVAFGVGLLHSDMPLTHEILVRTKPGFLDLMVALAGGAAGAYASSSARLSVSFVGVAVATALVPPLAASAILLARGEIHLALGAIMLAGTNIIAIQFSSSIVMWLIGFRNISHLSDSFWNFIRRDAPSIIIVFAMGGLFADNLHHVVKQQLFETQVGGILAENIARHPGAHLVDTRFEQLENGRVIVRAVVRSPTPPSSQEVAALENMLPLPPPNHGIELRIRYVATKVINRHGILFDQANEHGTSDPNLDY
jgi:uncharacterized hydrophobic protein (TIGR00271 family)